MTKQLGIGDDTGGPAPGARESAALMRRTLPSGSEKRGVTVRLPTAEAPAGHPPGDGPEVPPPQTDRLRYLDAATRQIARGMNLDETLYELCRAAVPAFADTAFVHLYAPLPIGDDIGAGPEILRLHTVDHASLRTPAGQGSASPAPSAHPLQAAEVVHPAATGLLAKLLQEGRPVFGDDPVVGSAAAELLGRVHMPPVGTARAAADHRPAARPQPRPGQRRPDPRSRPARLHRRRSAGGLPARHPHRPRAGQGDAVRA